MEFAENFLLSGYTTGLEFSGLSAPQLCTDGLSIVWCTSHVTKRKGKNKNLFIKKFELKA